MCGYQLWSRLFFGKRPPRYRRPWVSRLTAYMEITEVRTVPSDDEDRA